MINIVAFINLHVLSRSISYLIKRLFKISYKTPALCVIVLVEKVTPLTLTAHDIPIYYGAPQLHTIRTFNLVIIVPAYIYGPNFS